MSNPLGTMLSELHRLRKFVRDLNAEIERGPRVLKAHQAKLQKQEDALKLAQDDLKKQQVALKEKELGSKTATGQIAKYEKQRDEASEQKQLDALKNQIQHAKNAIATLDEECLSLLADIEEKQKKLPELEAALAKARADFATYQAEGAERLARMQGELKAATAELAAEEKKFTSADRPMYDRLVKSYAADCLAEVENSACSYCHTSITHQFQADIVNGKFVCCPTCGRGLYKR